MAKPGGHLARNCDNDVSKPRHIGCSNVHAPVTLADYVIGFVPKYGSALNPIFVYNYIIINCLLTICVHNYYAKPIYYTYVSIYREPLTDWSIHNPAATSTETPPHGLNNTKSEATLD